MLRSLQNFFLGLTCCLLLVACGGGNSSTTTISGPGLNSLGQSPAVSLFSAPHAPFTQRIDNLQVEVNTGPTRNFSGGSANILYATVTVCEPGTANCATVPHVLVDTGSVGLRVLASKLSRLNLLTVKWVDANLNPTANSYECYPFVIGGLWGRNVMADATMGRQTAQRIPIHLIEDTPAATVQATDNCIDASGGKIVHPDGSITHDGTVMLNGVDALGANGILGVGSTTVDCGSSCLVPYTDFVQYYVCPLNATSSANCAPAAQDEAYQVYNPISALPPMYNSGVVLSLPNVPWPGAVSATGELAFGVDPSALPAINQIKLGTDWASRPASYLNVTTSYTNRSGVAQSLVRSYLDTGTNGYFFTDNVIAPCIGSAWYCPASTLTMQAIISDGDNPSLHRMTVNFNIGNSETLFSTSNTAFGELGGSPPNSVSGFAWGLPFFFGKRVYLSIWADANTANGPWYAWELLP